VGQRPSGKDGGTGEGRGAHKILKRLDGVPHRGIVLYTSHDTGGRADVLNAHTERVERLPHVGKDGMTALRIGNRQDCSEGHALVGHIFRGAREIVDEQPPVRRLTHASRHRLGVGFYGTPFEPMLDALGLDHWRFGAAGQIDGVEPLSPSGLVFFVEVFLLQDRVNN
jgi:hypothetical protein